MKCSNLKSDLHRLHVINDQLCLCSESVEDCQHFLLHCNLYSAERKKMMEQLSALIDVTITTNLLLYGSKDLSSEINIKIFAFVESFILETGRF